MLWLNYFLLIRGIEFLRASLIFTGRIYNCFFVHNYLTNLNQQWPTTTNKQSTLPLRALAFIYHLKFSRIPNATQPQKLSAAGKTTSLLEYKVNHGQLLQSCPLPTAEIKTKTLFLKSSLEVLTFESSSYSEPINSGPYKWPHLQDSARDRSGYLGGVCLGGVCLPVCNEITGPT